jgi:hypothetical protein
MNLSETKLLLKEIADIDNRKLDEAVAHAWLAVLSPIPLEIAREAHILARRDDRINYLEPKHIVAWAKEAAFRLDKAKPNPEVTPKLGDPEPVCRQHSKRILSCDDCCRKIYEMGHLHDAALLLWAKEHVYA